jgi:hypothetical protein
VPVEDVEDVEVPVEDVEIIEPSGLLKLRLPRESLPPKTGTEALRDAVAKMDEVKADLDLARKRYPNGALWSDEARDSVGRIAEHRDYLNETLRKLRR